LTTHIGTVGPIAHQPAGFDKSASRTARRNRVTCRQDGEQDAPRAEETPSGDEQRVDFLARQALNGLVNAAAGGGLEHENLLLDSRCLNVA
jgi:hypothetical protein